MEWINVKDKLPPDHDLVLVYSGTTPNPYYSISRYISNGFPHGEKKVYWMPLPEPPKKQPTKPEQ